MEIECKFADRNWNRGSNSVYTCSVTSCDITDRNPEIAAFKGIHAPNRNNNDVKALRFYCVKVHYMPRHLSKIFPNLIYLRITKCELKEITAEDMIGLENVEEIYLDDNEITTVPQNLFRNMSNLREFYLTNNLIQKFNWKVLEPIQNTITSFYVYNNPGISEYFESFMKSFEDFIRRLKRLQTDEEIARNFEKVSKRLGNISGTKKHSNFTIKVRDKEYRVHKCILASQSSFFDKLISDDPEAVEEANEKIQNFEGNQVAFEEMLNFFYTKTIPSKESALELMELAENFDVPNLVMQCDAFVRKTNDLQFLHRYNLAVLQLHHPNLAVVCLNEPDLANQIVEAQREFNATRKRKLEEDGWTLK